MKRVLTLIVLLSISTIHSPLCAQSTSEEWITILVHGAIGLGANLSGCTISLIKRDVIEGSTYERNIKAIRNHPLLLLRFSVERLFF